MEGCLAPLGALLIFLLGFFACVPKKTPVVYSVMNQAILRVLLQLACEDTRSFHISTDLISTTIHTSRGAYPHFFVVRRQVQKNNKTQPNLRFGTDNNIRLSFTTLTSSNSQTIQWFTTVVRVRGLSLEDEYPSIAAILSLQ